MYCVESDDNGESGKQMKSVALVLPPDCPWPMETWVPFSAEHTALIEKLGIVVSFGMLVNDIVKEIHR